MGSTIAPRGVAILCDVSPTDPRDAIDGSTCVFVSTSVYVLVWMAVFLIHLSSALFVLVGAVAHLVLSLPTVHAATADLLIPVLLKQATGLAYLLVGCFHLTALARMGLLSCRFREVKLQRLSRHASLLFSSILVESDRPRSSTFCIRRQIAAMCNVIRLARQAYARVFGVNGHFGVNGKLFTVGLLLREVVEIIMQSYQLWALSAYVSRRWINHFAVTAVVTNCFSLLIVHLHFRRHQNVQRLMHLVVDMYLDYACSVVVPVCVLLPYLMAFEWQRGMFPAHLLADDVWLSNAVAESRHVLVTSPMDFFATLLPHYSIFACLRLIKQLVWRLPTRPTRVSAVSTSTNAKKATELHRPVSATSLLHSTPAGRVSRQVSRVISACIIAWGIVVAVLHIGADRAVNNADFPGCQLFVRPWLATKVTCSVLYVNCYRREITGQADEAGAVLDQVEPSVLTKVVFMHCPMLTVPANIVRFSSLGKFEIFNSTLVDWPVEASLRQSTHPRMVNVFIGASNVSTVPLGLLHRELPKAMLAVSFTNTTLDELPTNLGELWATSRLGRIGLDGTHVRTIPASLGQMTLRRLWMSRSPIERIPDEAFRKSKPITIRMSGMPLQRLPESVGDTSGLRELVVEYTNVSSLPTWATTWLEDHKTDSAVRSFFGSPVCELLDAALVQRWSICERDLESRYGLPLYSPGTQRYAL